MEKRELTEANYISRINHLMQQNRSLMLAVEKLTGCIEILAYDGYTEEALKLMKEGKEIVMKNTKELP